MITSIDIDLVLGSVTYEARIKATNNGCALWSTSSVWGLTPSPYSVWCRPVWPCACFCVQEGQHCQYLSSFLTCWYINFFGQSVSVLVERSPQIYEILISYCMTFRICLSMACFLGCLL